MWVYSLPSTYGRRPSRSSVHGPWLRWPTPIARLRSVAPALALRTELLVRSRDWERSGRAAGALVGARQQRRLSRGLTADGGDSTLEQAFLAASRRRSIRRATLSLLGSLLVGLAVLTGVTLQGVHGRLAAINIQQAGIYQQTNHALSVVKTDVYDGLRLAATLGGDESAAHADVVTGALADPVPDDAFTVPPGATRFADTPVGQRVVVVARNGTSWSRAARAVDQRAAQPIRAPIGGSPPSGWTVRAEPASGVVDVFHRRSLYRRIALPASPAVLELSPNQRELAAGVGAEVEVVDIDSGMIRTTLRGAPGTITDLAWNTDGDRVWALTARKAVFWSIRQGRILLDEPQRWFQAILPAQERGQAWVVSRDGLLRRIGLAAGNVVESRHVDDVILSAAGNCQGTTAVLIGLHKDWIISLAGVPGARPFQLHDCVEARPAFSLDSSSIFIPCTQGPVVQLSAATGREVQRILILQKGANAVAVAPSSGRLIVGGWGGELFQVDVTGRSARLLRDNECHPPCWLWPWRRGRTASWPSGKAPACWDARGSACWITVAAGRGTTSRTFRRIPSFRWPPRSTPPAPSSPWATATAR